MARRQQTGAALRVLPDLEMGFSVVNISYRLTPVALAPAAVEDARCALRWVVKNAKEYAFDVSKIVVTGHSAGGHLALTTGFLPGGGELDRECLGPEEPKVAAVLNWFGITDVVWFYFLRERPKADLTDLFKKKRTPFAAKFARAVRRIFHSIGGGPGH